MALRPTIGRIAPDCERAAWWLEVYGSLEVPLVSPVAESGWFPDGAGGEEVKMFYRVDLGKLSVEQRDRAVRFVAEKFGISESEVREDIDATGIPVLAEDVLVSFDARLVL